MTELYTCKNGQTLQNEEQSALMYRLVAITPEKEYTRDDMGTASLMCDLYGDSIRYCPQNGCWYILDRCWRRQNENGEVSDRLQTLLNLLHIYANVELQGDDDALKEYRKYVSGTRRYTSMRNILEVFKVMVRMQLADTDRDPYLFNTPARAYNLKSGQVVTDFENCNVTKLSATSLPGLGTETCDRWYQFVDEIMSHDAEKAAFLQRALGYSLLGVNREECMFIAYGSTTRNGKGTLFSTINSVLGGDYADTAPVDLICERKNKGGVDFNAPQPALAKLVGTRLVTMSESPRDVRLDAAAMKTLTGRDSLTTRGLFENAFTFTPQFTIWLNTNYLPAVNDDTVFSSDRVWVIEFSEHFDPSRQDKDLKELFSAPENRPTILKWLMDGVQDYMENGLNPPACVLEATANYRRIHDRMGSFIADKLALGLDYAAPRGDVYSAYRSWCALPENRFSPMGSTGFYSEMSSKGFASVRHADGWYIKGCKIK